MELIKIENLKVNPNNPRIIKDDNFKKLVLSIKEFPEMLQLRPIVVNEEMVILGGNMRYRACLEAGKKEVPVIIAKGLSEEKQKEFLIKDNVSGGEWDYDVLANEWSELPITEWGVNVWQPNDDLFSIDEEDEDETGAGSKEPKASDDGFSIFEMVMEHENKIVLVELLNKVKKEYAFEKLEDALMEVVRVYKKN
jgi:hypothetical protein